MKATIKINMDNAAFADAPAQELTRILCDIVRKIESGERIDTVRDLNGNTCGVFIIQK